jgi:hypothetical protein
MALMLLALLLANTFSSPPFDIFLLKKSGKIFSRFAYLFVVFGRLRYAKLTPSNCRSFLNLIGVNEIA